MKAPRLIEMNLLWLLHHLPRECLIHRGDPLPKVTLPRTWVMMALTRNEDLPLHRLHLPVVVGLSRAEFGDSPRPPGDDVASGPSEAGPRPPCKEPH